MNSYDGLPSSVRCPRCGKHPSCTRHIYGNNVYKYGIKCTYCAIHTNLWKGLPVALIEWEGLGRYLKEGAPIQPDLFMEALVNP